MPPKSSERWPAERIGRVARHIKLDDVHLVACSASAVPAEDFDAEDYDTRWSIRALGPDGQISEESQTPIDLSEGLLVIASFNYHKTEADATPSDDDGEQDLDLDRADVFAAFTLTYSPNSDEAPLEVEAQDILAFTDYNAAFNAWPYWREFVQSMTARMGMPRITIPLLAVPDLTRRAPSEA